MPAKNTYTEIKLNDQKVMVDSTVVGDIVFDNPQNAGRINSIFASTGRMPSRAWFVMQKTHFDALDLGAAIVILWRTFQRADDTVAWTLDQIQTYIGFRVVDSYAACSEFIGGPMVVELADVRYYKSATSGRYDENDGHTWSTVLAEVAGDLPVGHNFYLTNNPSPAPSPIIYELDSWKVLSDIGARTGHVMFHDPDSGDSSFAPYGESQPDLATLLSGALIYKNWTVPDTEERESIGAVYVHFWWEGSAEQPQVLQVINPNGGTGSMVVWGWNYAKGSPGSNPSNLSALQSESAAIGQSIFDWSAQQQDRQDIEILGLGAYHLGSEVSQIRWQLRDGETFTRVTVGDHPEPEFIVPRPPQSYQRDWVTIRVKNKSGVIMRAWSSVHVEGLVNYGFEPPTISDPPPGLESGRLFNATWGYIRTYNPNLPSLTTEWMADNFWHAVVPGDLDPEEIGIAVIKGCVPGLLTNQSSAAQLDPRTPVYTYVMPERPPLGGAPFSPNRLTPRIWVLADTGLMGSCGNVSILRSVWKSYGHDIWGMIDLNHQTNARACSVPVTLPIVAINNQGTSNLNQDLPPFEAYLPFFGNANFASIYPANSICETPLNAGGTGNQNKFGILFKRQAYLWFRVWFVWRPAGMAVAPTTVSGIYRGVGQRIAVFIDWIDADTGAVLVSQQVTQYNVNGYLAATSTYYSMPLNQPGDVLCHVCASIASYKTSTFFRPQVIRLRVKWENEAGGTSGMSSFYPTSFFDCYCDIQIFNHGVYPIQHNGNIYHPPEQFTGGSEPPGAVYGCTDPAADNFDPLATIDDGSCVYVPNNPPSPIFEPPPPPPGDEPPILP